MAMDVRVAAARVIAATLREQASLATLIPDYQRKVKPRDTALLQELCFGTLRHYPKLAVILQQLLAKPFKAKDTDVQGLLACGLYQLMETRIPPHAAIGETVQAAVGLQKMWAKGLVNGVLRNFQRQQESILSQWADDPAFQTAHPDWLRSAIQAAWPQQAQAIFVANNHRPPMTLRVNQQKTSRENYAKLLENDGIGFEQSEISEDALILKRPLDVAELPHFSQGWVSVQDEAAQLCTGLLDIHSGMRVLDACCAPGGKTCHILERQPKVDMVALDIEEARLQRVQENLDRLQLQAQLISCDAANTDKWWDGAAFDRILLDAPCSATGVIRRHPDIKVLRRREDIDKLAAVQQQLLRALWPLLKPGGKLLYATCSILPAENDQLVAAALQQLPDGHLVPLHADWGQRTTTGRQLFPCIEGNDGFYYALLQKAPVT